VELQGLGEVLTSALDTMLPGPRPPTLGFWIPLDPFLQCIDIVLILLINYEQCLVSEKKLHFIKFHDVMKRIIYVLLNSLEPIFGLNYSDVLILYTT
jgi:hypothetical protein